MKNYRILSATNVDTLAEYVETAINDGWELHGFVFKTHIHKEAPGGAMVNQAIIKITTDRPGVLNESRNIIPPKPKCPENKRFKETDLS